MKRIYFDFAATTPVRKKVFEKMSPYFSRNFGNPSSLHWFGQRALKAIDESREKIKNFLRANSIKEIIFTSSATESNNLVIKGLALDYYFNKKIKPHFITTTIEHDSVLKTFSYLEKLKIAEIDYVSPRKDTLIYVEDIIKKIKENTVLISVHYVNSELGTIQKIDEIAKKVKQIRNDLLVHTDAAQAGFENLNVQELGVDFMTLSSHKIYGPKGIALLYKKEDISLLELISGSGQEYNLRGGTEAVPLIIGFTEALEFAVTKRLMVNKFLTKIRDYFCLKLTEFYDKILFNTLVELSSPKILNLYFPTKTAQELLIFLDTNGIAVSLGTACQSRSAKPNEVISKLFSEERAKKSLRFSFGIFNKKEDIDFLVDCLKKIFKKK